MAREKQIPNKMYFRIGEVAEFLNIKPYVLRYWETEFPDIKPVKSQSNQRLYKRRDVEMLVAIKRLLYEEKFTINGARQHLKDMMKGHVKVAESEAPSGKTVSTPIGKSKVASENVRKILAVVKGDLHWCLSELRK